VEVFVRRGQLRIRILSPIPAFYQGFPLHPDDETDPYAFRIDLSEFGFGTFPVVFSRKAETATTAVHLDVMPLTAHKRPAATNPRLWAEGAIALAIAAVLDRGRRTTRRPHRTT
jgi:hypothetical protein